MAKETLLIVNLTAKTTQRSQISAFIHFVWQNIYIKRQANQKLSLYFKHAAFFLSPILADGLIYFQIKNGPWSGNCWTES